MTTRNGTKFFPSIVCIQQWLPIWIYKFNITTRHWIISLSSEVQKNICFKTVTPVRNNFWSQAVNWAWMVSCLGSWDLYPGSFKQKNKCTAEGKARGWQLAGFFTEWRILAGSAATHELWNVTGCAKGDGSTDSCPVWYRVLLQHKQGPACFPLWSQPVRLGM